MSAAVITSDEKNTKAKAIFPGWIQRVAGGAVTVLAQNKTGISIEMPVEALVDEITGSWPVRLRSPGQ